LIAASVGGLVDVRRRDPKLSLPSDCMVDTTLAEEHATSVGIPDADGPTHMPVRG